jgi:hypothetical protein
MNVNKIKVGDEVFGCPVTKVTDKCIWIQPTAPTGKSKYTKAEIEKHYKDREDQKPAIKIKIIKMSKPLPKRKSEIKIGKVYEIDPLLNKSNDHLLDLRKGDLWVMTPIGRVKIRSTEYIVLPDGVDTTDDSSAVREKSQEVVNNKIAVEGFCRIWERWQDEEGYESFDGYGDYMKALLKKLGLKKFIKATPKPFGCEVQYRGHILKFTVKEKGKQLCMAARWKLLPESKKIKKAKKVKVEEPIEEPKTKKATKSSKKDTKKTNKKAGVKKMKISDKIKTLFSEEGVSDETKDQAANLVMKDKDCDKSQAMKTVRRIIRKGSFKAEEPTNKGKKKKEKPNKKDKGGKGKGSKGGQAGKLTKKQIKEKKKAKKESAAKEAKKEATPESISPYASDLFDHDMEETAISKHGRKKKKSLKWAVAFYNKMAKATGKQLDKMEDQMLDLIFDGSIPSRISLVGEGLLDEEVLDLYKKGYETRGNK